MDPEYIPEQYLERLREANAAIIEFEHLIATREEELRAAREEINALRERLASAHVQAQLLESLGSRAPTPGQARSRGLPVERLAELRATLEQIIALAGGLRTEAENTLAPPLLERLDEMIRCATAARDILR